MVMTSKPIIKLSIAGLVLLTLGLALLLWHQQEERPAPPGTTKPMKTVTSTTPIRVPSIPKPVSSSPTLRSNQKTSADFLTSLLGAQNEKSYPAYSRALAALGSLTQPQQQSCCKFLKSHQPPDGLEPQQVHALKNELLNLLREQEPPPPGLSQTLIDLFSDREQDPVIREYTLQHLSLWYEKATADEQQTFRSLFWKSLSETDTNIAGTGLLALYHLESTVSEMEREKVQSAAQALAEDPACSRPSRLTALQVCGRMGVKNVLPVALDVAEQAEQLTLRIAAIATLGDLGQGNPEIQSFLEEKMNDQNRVIRIAAASALERLNEGDKK